MKKNGKLPAVKPVKLKPLLGMKPGAWLFVCYLIVIIMVVFAVGFLPGIIDGYMRVTFDNPLASRTAVYIDDEYYGATPFTINVGSGNHVVKYQIGNVVVDEFEMEVDHPYFFTWLFPRKVEVIREACIDDSTYGEITDNFMSDVSAYSAVLTYDNVYKYPPLFVNYVNAAYGMDNADKVIEYAVQFITSQEMLDDAKKAFDIMGKDYDFSKIENAVVNKSFRNSSLPIYAAIEGLSELKTDNFTISGFNYGMFNMASLPVNETMYAYFVKANPQWAKENKKNLIELGLVDEYYLEDVSLDVTVPSVKPIRNISFNAAVAFCQWLSEETGKEVSLPTEVQWTAAASTADQTFTKSLSAFSNNMAPAGMFGGVWEYTSTYYIPNDNIITSDIQNFIALNGYECEIVAKGGSYVSDMSKINAYTIGIVSPYLCSDYYGFRIAWK